MVEYFLTDASRRWFISSKCKLEESFCRFFPANEWKNLNEHDPLWGYGEKEKSCVLGLGWGEFLFLPSLVPRLALSNVLGAFSCDILYRKLR